jgi:hypothetical protein
MKAVGTEGVFRGLGRSIYDERVRDTPTAATDNPVQASGCLDQFKILSAT